MFDVQLSPKIIYETIKYTISIIKYSVFTYEDKNFGIRCDSIRNLVAKVEYLLTKSQMADMFTNTIRKPQYVQFKKFTYNF